MVQAVEAKSPNAEILEKLALEHLDTLKLLAKNSHEKSKK